MASFAENMFYLFVVTLTISITLLTITGTAVVLRSVWQEVRK